MASLLHEMILVGDQRMTLERFQASKNLKVQGNLDLSRTPITSLPDGLKVGGDLNLSDISSSLVKSIISASLRPLISRF